MKNLKKLTREDLKIINGGYRDPIGGGGSSGDDGCSSGCAFVGKSPDCPNGYAKQRWNVAGKYCDWINC